MVDIGSGGSALTVKTYAVSDATQFSTSSTSYVDVTNHTKTITLTAAPVYATFHTYFANSGGGNYIQILEGATPRAITYTSLGNPGTGSGAMWTGTAGSQTIKVQMKVTAGTGYCNQGTLGMKTFSIIYFDGAAAVA